METAEAVLKFLRSVGPAKEAELYLRQFRDTPRESFALLAVDGTTLSDNADAVAVDLRFLTLLQLTPVVLLGLQDLSPVASHQRALLSLLKGQGVAAEAFCCSDSAAIVAALREGTIPVLRPAQGDTEARWLALGQLLTTLRTHKLVFLRQSGGLRADGERISLVNLEGELPELLHGGTLSAEERALLQLAHILVFELVPHRLSIALTSPLNLLHELFTVRGAGTLLRRAATIERHSGLAGVDRERLLASLEASFERYPKHSLLDRAYAHCYVESQYRGVALLLDSPFGGYLSKFAVTRQAQGEGIGRDLWRAITRDYDQLLWRARRHNPVHSWYEQQCEGMFRQGQWTIYSRGISARQLPEAIDYVLAQPLDFEDQGAATDP